MERWNLCTTALRALFVGSMAFGVASCDFTINNNGEGEGEGEVVAEGEGEAQALAGLGESCRISRENCETDLVCVQEGINADIGRCRAVCGSLDLTTGAVDKSGAGSCPTGTTCQVVTPIPTLIPTNANGVVCIPQGAKNGLCASLGDENACSETGQACEIVVFSDDDASTTADDDNIADELRCRTSCETSATCGEGEACLEDGFVTVQQGANNTRVSCDLALCADGGTDCTCDATQAFECLELNVGPVCAKLTKKCGIAIPTTDSADLEGQLPPEQLCAAVSGLTGTGSEDVTPRYCDSSEFAGVDDAAQVFCNTGLFGSNAPADLGVCVAVCATPDTDANDDGTLAADERGDTSNCSTAHPTCSASLGRDLFLVATVVEDDATDIGVKACNPANCAAGTDHPCPEECGPGQTECVETSVGNLCLGFASLCDVAPPNTAPVAAQLTRNVLAGSADLSFAAADLCSDADVGATLTLAVTSITGSTGAFSSVTGTIAFPLTYNVADAAVGTDVLAFSCSDGTATVTTGTITVVTTAAPTASAKTATTTFAAAPTTFAKADLCADLDANSTLTVALDGTATLPAGGAFALVSGDVVYTPAASGTAGVDVQSFTCSDGTNTSAAATISVTVN